MAGVKVIAVLLGETAVAILAALNGLAEEIVLWSAAGAGLLWFLVNVFKPGVRWMRSIFRSAEVFEQLPETVAMLEAELGRLTAALSRIENRQRAFNRDLGVRVRSEEPYDVEDGDENYPGLPSRPSAPE